MKNKSELNQLIILSKDFEIYKQIIEQARLPGLTILAMDDPGEAIPCGTECNLLFGEPSLLSEVINHLPNLKWVQTSWAGVEPLFALGMRQDYVLTNARYVYGPMMSEYVFGYLLMVERQFLARWQSQLKRNWDGSTPGTLKGKCIGLLGVGTIGAHLATTAHHFGMTVYGLTRQSEACPDVDRYFHASNVSAFTSELDYLVCSLPGTPETKGIINSEFLSGLPQKAWLVNIGRGSAVDESALVEALNNGTLAGAILDVFTKEPLPADHPLWNTPNTYITFHTAARNYLPDIASLFIENYKLFIEGKALSCMVDFKLRY